MEQGIRIRTVFLLYFIMAMWMPQMLSAQSCLSEGITFRTQSQIDSFPINYPNCTEIVGDVTIIPISEIVNLDSLYVVTAIGGELMINQCLSLLTLNGLHNLQNIGGSLTIVNNINLKNLHALSNLRTIGLVLTIFNNDRIKTLHGLDSLDSESIVALSISNNNSLSWCAVESVCQYIADPNASVVINENSSDCYSVEIVEGFCQHVGIPVSITDPRLSAYPNPFTTSTAIEYEVYTRSNIQYTVYNSVGEAVVVGEERNVMPGNHTITLSLHHLPAGLYYSVLRSGEGVSVVKVVKQ